MALKPCRECKKKVSTEATTCPNCGVPNPTRFEKYYQIPDEDSFSAEKRVNAERKKAIDNPILLNNGLKKKFKLVKEIKVDNFPINSIYKIN